MLKFSIPETIDRKSSYCWLASWLGCGFISPGPGTWGTLGGLPFGALIYWYTGPLGLLIATGIIYWLGLRSAAQFDSAMKGHDSKMIVIDEVAGIWLVLSICGISPPCLLLAFVLFRFFDILKPPPIGWIDRQISGAQGVMLDDIVAGLMAALVLLILKNVIGFE